MLRISAAVAARYVTYKQLQLSLTAVRAIGDVVSRAAERMTALSVEDPYSDHLFDGTKLNVYSEDVLNLSAGAPGPDLLRMCVDLFQEATAHRLELEREKAYLFQYGPTPGMWKFRDALATFLSKIYGDEVRREHLIQTCGATHGLQLCLQTFLWPNSVIFVEDATYMIALDAFKQFPYMKIVPVPLTKDGIDVEALETIATEEKLKRNWNVTEERPFWSMLYIIPCYQNPTGITLTERTCQKIVEVARKLDILVACDDVYNLLYYDGDGPPKRLFAYDFLTEGYKGGHIASNGTFSKILSPGVRVGWLELPPRLAVSLRKSGIMHSGGATNHYVSGLLTSMLELGTQEKHLEHMRETFKARMNAFCDVLEAHLPKECSFMRPGGGFFVWVHLPEYVDAEAFTDWAIKKYKITCIPGSRFSVEKKHANCIRLGIAFHSKEKLMKAGEILCTAIRQYLSETCGK